MFRTLFGALALVIVAAVCAPAAAGPTVAVDSGRVEGEAQGDINVFRGIPYAAPPVGPLRWRPTQAAARWDGVRPARTFGAACPQPERLSAASGGVAARQDEDCLTLNVWTPANARGAPVMVWIHGGAHRAGASSYPIYDGTAFARDGVLLVSINYRLGLLGYFAHPALTRAAAPDEPLGNYGLMDQIAALRWVRANITRFGGDPDNVTVFGESAGGESIVYLLTTPSARGLFNRAIIESGGGIGQPPNLAAAERAGVEQAGRIGLPADVTPEQMRARPASDWLHAQGGIQGAGFGEMVDGRMVTEPAWRTFLAGRAQDVPLIIGSNSNEASVLFALGARPNLQAFAGDRLAEMRTAYGNPSDDELIRQALGDVAFGAPARFIATAEAGGAPAWLYHFSYVAQMRRGQVPGAAHGTEIPYVFASWERMPMLARFVGPEDQQMSQLMHACWVSFARTGRPACPGHEWPAYTQAGDQTLEFGSPVTLRTGFRKAQYDFLMSRLTATGRR